MKTRLLLDCPGRKFDMAIGNSGAKDGELDSNWPKAACAQYATLTFRAAKTSRLRRPLASQDSAVTSWSPPQPRSGNRERSAAELYRAT